MDAVGHTLIKAPTRFEVKVNTLTYDNEKEFLGYALIDVALKNSGYLASLERGTNHNFNRFSRYDVPQKHPMKDINDQEIKMIEHRMNNRTRKRLEFKAPAEVFHQSLSRVALRA